MMQMELVPPNEVDEAFFAGQREIVPKFFYYLPEERKAEARAALRDIARGHLFRSDDGMCNVALEEIWNALLGND